MALKPRRSHSIFILIHMIPKVNLNDLRDRRPIFPSILNIIILARHGQIMLLRRHRLLFLQFCCSGRFLGVLLHRSDLPENLSALLSLGGEPWSVVLRVLLAPVRVRFALRGTWAIWGGFLAAQGPTFYGARTFLVRVEVFLLGLLWGPRRIECTGWRQSLGHDVGRLLFS